MEEFEVRDARNGDWFWVDKEVLSSNISSSAKLIYCALAFFSNDTSQKCFPSYSAISKITGISSRSTISKGILELVNSGFIKKDAKWGKPTTYTLLKIKKYHQSKNWTSTPPVQKLDTNNINNNIKIGKRNFTLNELKRKFLLDVSEGRWTGGFEDWLDVFKSSWQTR